ncbi:MAG: DUF362 domain-containing protein [Desulfobacterales bacterium]|nr:DUF362 domain-containing protein [Desulfobacterales bacterium]
MSKVMIHPATYADVRPAVERAFELFPLDLKGKKVLLKPNLLRGSRAEEGVVTHPAVLRAVVEKVETMGPAQIVVGDNPGLFGYGANEQCFQQTGLMEAAKGYYRNIGNDGRGMAFNPDFVPQVSISQAVLDADVVISLPKFKTHGLTVITGAIKNSYGMLPGAQKAMIHKAAGNPRRFQEAVVEVFRLRVPDLFIMDAVVGMEGNGPASPDLRDIGVIMAADNAVAMDAVMAHMMGCPPERLPFLQKAKALGLGDYDLAAIEIDGELRQIPNFKLPSLGGEAIASNATIQAFLHSKTVLRPKADPELCTGCGTCVAQCPAQALSIPEELPRVDADKCIVCFCCQEICPEKAITLQ